MGLCALILAAPAAAHIFHKPGSGHAPATLRQRLAFERHVIRHDRQALRFFRRHRWLLARHNPYHLPATHQLRFHRAQLARARRELRRTRSALARRERRLASRRVHRAAPGEAIRRVFGPRYWRQALAVARCESGLSIDARNGQYVGLFQMGNSERSYYGHGETAYAQAEAAHRYFVASGRDWSPWSCKPWW